MPQSISGNFTTKKRPSVILAILLFLLCIIPAIVYLIAASKDDVSPFSIQITPEGSGTRIVASGQGKGFQVAQGAIASLPA